METAQVQDLLERIAVSVEGEAENSPEMPRFRLTLDQLAETLCFPQMQWHRQAIDQLSREIAYRERSNARPYKFLRWLPLCLSQRHSSMDLRRLRQLLLRRRNLQDLSRLVCRKQELQMQLE